MFITVRQFQPSLIFAGKAEALASTDSYGTVMLSAIMLSVVMPSVVAPIPEPQKAVPPPLHDHQVCLLNQVIASLLILFCLKVCFKMEFFQDFFVQKILNFIFFSEQKRAWVEPGWNHYETFGGARYLTVENQGILNGEVSLYR
jgi:hypothetical protein